MTALEKKKEICPEAIFLFPGFKDAAFLNFILDYHLGAGYILAYLKERGVFATQFIHREPIGLSDLAEKVLKQNPKIVGFTCYDTNYYLIKLISKSLKKKNNKLIIIAGGPTATFSDELIMRDTQAIDICVRGEGEHAVYELISQLKSGRDISNIKGITYRLKAKLIRTPDRSLLRAEKKGEELDIFPSPYLSNIFPDNIFVANANFGILTSRGCVFKCIYCNFSAMSGGKIRYHSIERVISELKTIDKWFKNRNIEMITRRVLIYDDVFSQDIQRAKHICQRIIEEKINLIFWTDTRADKVDRDLLNLMHRAGIRDINFGLESVSAKVLNTVKKMRAHPVKGDNLLPEKRYIRKVRENILIAKRIGLEPTVSVIMALPGATSKDDRKTINFIKQLKVNNFYYNYLMVFPGTELFNSYRKYGLGIKKALTVLPYQVKYAYDEDKIPQTDNFIQRSIKIETMERLMRLITGDYADRTGNGYPDLLLNNCHLDAKIINWIKQSIAISSAIVFVDTYSERSVFLENIKKMIFSDLPALNFYLLSYLDKKDAKPLNSSYFNSGKYKISLSSEIISSKRKKFLDLGLLEHMPFVNYDFDYSAALRPPKIESKTIFKLTEREDLEKLLGLISHSDKEVLKGSCFESDGYFLDECRWSKEDCPAIRFQRAIIEDKDLILPCFNGKPIATLDDVRKVIVNNLRLLMYRTQEKRNCQKCAVRDNCSKCLFPYPMDSEEYCLIRRRRHFQIDRFFRLLKITRKIRSSNPDMRLKLDEIKYGFDNELSLISAGSKRYVFHPHFGKLSELSKGELI